MANTWTPNHTRLREVLAHLYLDEDDIKRIASDAGVDLAHLELNDTAENNWQEVVVEAEKQGLLVRVIEAAQCGYEKDEDLIDLLGVFGRFQSGATRAGGIPIIPGAAGKTKNPYRGMEFFEEEHEDYFFGRDDDIANLAKLLNEKDLLAVTGPSGCGKSSLLQAGLVPELKRQDSSWVSVRFTPYQTPLDRLLIALKKVAQNTDFKSSEARQLLLKDPDDLTILLSELRLGSPDNKLLLLADQFEELFTFRNKIDPEDRKAFLQALICAAKVEGVKVIVSFRNDFYQFVMDDPLFGPAINENVVNIRPLNPAGLLKAVDEPARKTGVTFQNGLVDTILKETLDQPGSLPFLEYTLAELWDKKTADNVMTLEVYERIGRVEGAIAKKAESQYASYDEKHKRAFDKFIVRLVHPGQKTESTRQAAEKEDIVADGRALGVDTWEMVDRLAKARLVVVSTNEVTRQVTVEVAHEALIRTWDHLDHLVKADSRFRSWIVGSLKPEYERWKKGDQSPNRLLSGGDLKTAQTWLAKYADDLGVTERAFIFHSLLNNEEDLKPWMGYFQPLEDALEFLDGYLEKEDPKKMLLGINALRCMPHGEVGEEAILSRLEACVTGSTDPQVSSQAAVAIAERGHADRLAKILRDNAGSRAGSRAGNRAGDRASSAGQITMAIAKARNTPGIGKQVWDELDGPQKRHLRVPSIVGLLLDHRQQLGFAIVVPYLFGEFVFLLAKPIILVLRWFIYLLGTASGLKTFIAIDVGLGSFDLVLIFALLLYTYLRRVYVEGRCSLKAGDLFFIGAVSTLIGIPMSVLDNYAGLASGLNGLSLDKIFWPILLYLGPKIGRIAIMFTLIFNLHLENMKDFGPYKALRLSLFCVGIAVPFVVIFATMETGISGNMVFISSMVVYIVFSLLQNFLFLFASLTGFGIGLRFSFPTITGQPVPNVSPAELRRLWRIALILYLVTVAFGASAIFVRLPYY